MEQIARPVRNPAQILKDNAKWLLPSLVFFLVLTGIQLWQAYRASIPEVGPTGVPISKAIEERYGVRFTGLNVVGKGGLIDLRYQVLDVGKAKNFGHYTETSPLLIAEDSGKTIEVTIMMLHNHRVDTGRTYYILYRNTGDAIKPGRPVTLKLDDLQLEHVIAR